MTIKTDPIFQNAIPPLTEEGYSQLRDNILADGEVEQDMYDRSTVPEFSIDHQADDIRLSAEVFSGTIRQTLIERSYVLTEENKAVVIEAIDRFIIKGAELLIEQLQTDLGQFRQPAAANGSEREMVMV